MLANIPRVDNQQTIRRILLASGEIFSTMKITMPQEWLTSEMTVAQLRLMLLLFSEGPMKMTDIASYLNIKLATATGLVNNLVEKRTVTREEDPDDRRCVICTLTTAGNKTIQKMWSLSASKMELMLQGLSDEQLKKAEEVVGFLLQNVKTNFGTV